MEFSLKAIVGSFIRSDSMKLLMSQSRGTLMNDVLPSIIFQLGLGGVGGFIMGYALKKISKNNTSSYRSLHNITCLLRRERSDKHKL